MPSFNGTRNHPQRRVFRGRGGPTDGNLPPKKTTRRRVKYQPGGEDAGHGPNHAGGDEGFAGDGGRGDDNYDDDNVDDESNSSLDRDVRNLALGEGADDDMIPHDGKFLLEMEHLHRRIEHVQLSLQTSRGLANPHTWRMNCLLPTRNVVREWRCILAYYNTDHSTFRESDGKVEATPAVRNSDSSSPRRIDVKNDLQPTSQKVFALIQMSVQTGPLVGSNPGYFKRCGGEVASMALSYLCEIAELAGVEKNTINIATTCDRRLIRNGPCDEEPYDVSSEQHETEEHLEEEADTDCSSEESVESCDASLSESDISDSKNCKDDDDFFHDEIIDDTLPKSKSPKSPDLVVSSPSETLGREIIGNLQKSLLFTEKQSQKMYQWFGNAENAIERNTTPSKSASKLQSLKSKKQTLKELKIQRKHKKKKKGDK